MNVDLLAAAARHGRQRAQLHRHAGVVAQSRSACWAESARGRRAAPHPDGGAAPSSSNVHIRGGPFSVVPARIDTYCRPSSSNVTGVAAPSPTRASQSCSPVCASWAMSRLPDPRNTRLPAVESVPPFRPTPSFRQTSRFSTGSHARRTVLGPVSSGRGGRVTPGPRAVPVFHSLGVYRKSSSFS